MFKLLKWSVLILLLITISYGVVFFISMDQTEKLAMKKDAIVALDSGDIKVLIGPLSQKIKQDLEQKKASFSAGLRQKLKDILNRWIDGE